MAAPVTFSIVIPAYNAEKYLEATIESALASTYPSVEVVIVNDGSTDGTQRIIERFARRDPRVRGVVQENRGTSAALNRAVRESSGTYLLPLGADDLISNDYVERAVAVLERNGRVKVVYAEAEFIGDRTGRWNLPPFDRRLLARKNIIYACAVFRRADFDRAGGFCEEIVGREDWDFWISLLKRGGDVVRLPTVCFYYRVHAVSRRRATRGRKRELVDILNTRHKAFFHRALGGRLHYLRTWSRPLNALIRLVHPDRIHCSPAHPELDEVVYTCPERFDGAWPASVAGPDGSRGFDVAGRLVTITRYDEPPVLRQLVRRAPLGSRAHQAFDDAARLSADAAPTLPVGFYERRTAFWCTVSYLVSSRPASPEAGAAPDHS